MPDSIKSGSNGQLAEVNGFGELTVRATQQSLLKSMAEEANSFAINSTLIALTTTASYNGILYVKNLSAIALHICNIFAFGTQLAYWQCWRQPTTGTLISAGTSGVGYNTNFSSAVQCNSTIMNGADAKTITDGNLFADFITPVGGSILDVQQAIILPSNGTIAFTCKPTVAGSFSLTLLVAHED